MNDVTFSEPVTVVLPRGSQRKVGGSVGRVRAIDSRIDGVYSPATGALRPRLWCCTIFLQPSALASARNGQPAVVRQR